MAKTIKRSTTTKATKAAPRKAKSTKVSHKVSFAAIERKYLKFIKMALQAVGHFNTASRIWIKAAAFYATIKAEVLSLPRAQRDAMELRLLAPIITKMYNSVASIKQTRTGGITFHRVSAGKRRGAACTQSVLAWKRVHMSTEELLADYKKASIRVGVSTRKRAIKVATAIIAATPQPMPEEVAVTHVEAPIPTNITGGVTVTRVAPPGIDTFLQDELTNATAPTATVVPIDRKAKKVKVPATLELEGFVVINALIEQNAIPELERLHYYITAVIDNAKVA